MLADPEQLKLLKRVGRGVRHLPGEMNSLEREYAAHLKLLEHTGEVEWSMFEAIKLRLADGCWYTPDFLVMAANGEIEIHEVKAYWKKQKRVHFEDDALVKWKVAAKTFPFRFISVAKVDGQWVRKEM